jgi:hypothetical protein
MKRTWWSGLLVGLIGSLALVVIVGAVHAQSDVPPDKVITVQPLAPSGGGGPNALLGTTFSYQGLLKIGGVPYTGNCDMQFTLWNGNPGSGGISITTVSALPLPTGVSAGLFTTYVDFGNQFKGDYRALEPLVRCPSGSGGYQSLGVQTIYPAPYALGLRPGTIIAGAVNTGLTVNASGMNGTGIFGEADNGSNAWGVAGYSNSGIGVMAISDNNASTPHTALRIFGGSLTVGGAVKPAFVYTVVVGGGACASISNPLTNGHSDAILIVTPLQNTGAAINPATDVYVAYSSGAGGFWNLCRSSGTLATNMQYNILVINQ